MFPNFSAYRPFRTQSQKRRRVQTRKVLIFAWDGEQYALPIEGVLRVIEKGISSESLLGGYRLIQHQEMFITVINPDRLLLKSSANSSDSSPPAQQLGLPPNPDLPAPISGGGNLDQIYRFHYLIICPFLPSPLSPNDSLSASQVQDSDNFSLSASGEGFPRSAQGSDSLNYVGIPSVDLPTVLDVSATAFQPLPHLYRDSLRSPGIEAVIYLSENLMLFYLNLSKLLLALKTQGF